MTTTADSAPVEALLNQGPALLPPGVRALRCAPGRSPEELTSLVGVARERGDVLWVDVPSTSDLDQTLETLRMLDATVSEEVVRDLLERDDLAKFCDGDGPIRNVSIVGMQARPADSDAPGEVVFQMVETLVGDGWLVTCWQTASHFTGKGTPRDGAPILQEKVEAQVRRRWIDGDCETSGELATALVDVLAEDYRSAHRLIEHWLQVWELEFHAGREKGPGTLKQLLALVNEARRRLAALNNMRCQTENRMWFPHVSKKELDEHADNLLDRALERLSLLFESIRADMELVCMEKMVSQAETAEANSRAELRFQTQLGKVTALLLVPTLIAGVFGANTRLPGGGTWTGFDAMVALMVVTSATVYLFMVRKPFES